MRTTLISLLLLSLALTGCVIEPGGGYEHHAWNGHHGDYHYSDR